MKIFVIRKKLLNTDSLPSDRGEFTFEISLELDNGMKQHYDEYISLTSGKTKYIHENIFPNLANKDLKRMTNKFRASKTIYQKILDMSINDFLYYTGKPTENIIYRKQIFIPTQIINEPIFDLENNIIIIKVNSLSKPKEKQYGNQKEISAFMAPGTLYKVKEEFYDTLLYRGIGTIIRNNNLYVPMDISINPASDNFISIEDVSSLIAHIKKHFSYMEIDPNNVPFEIEIHSPGKIVIKLGEITMNALPATPVISEYLNPDFTSALNASSAINTQEQIKIKRMKKVTIFKNNNINTITTIYDSEEN